MEQPEIMDVIDKLAIAGIIILSLLITYSVVSFFQKW